MSSFSNTANLLKRLEGVVVALATPLDDRGELDRSAYQRLINRVINSGASGVLALGWMGEQPCLTDSTRDTVMKEVVQITAGRVSTIIGVSEQSLSRTITQALLARQAGADIILSTAPYSYSMPQDMVYDFFYSLNEKIGLPLIAYHNEETSVPIELETAVRLSGTSGIIGIKDNSNLVRLQRLLRQADRPGQFAVIGGNEYLFGPALLVGTRYSILGGPGNLMPGWCVKMYHIAKQGDWNQLANQHQRLVDFCEAMYTGADSPYSAVKYALSKIGLCTSNISCPLPPVSEDHKKCVDEALCEFADMLE